MIISTAEARKIRMIMNLALKKEFGNDNPYFHDCFEAKLHQLDAQEITTGLDIDEQELILIMRRINLLTK